MYSAVRHIFTDMETEASNSVHLKLKSLLQMDRKAKIPPRISKKYYVGVWRNWERPSFFEVATVLLG